MIITKSLEDQRIIIMAHRHCLGHGNALVPHGFTTWLTSNWSQLLPSTQIAILKDTVTAIPEMAHYRDEWEIFASWAFGYLLNEDRLDLHSMLDADGRATLARLATNCSRCGFEHHVCLCGRS